MNGFSPLNLNGPVTPACITPRGNDMVEVKYTHSVSLRAGVNSIEFEVQSTIYVDALHIDNSNNMIYRKIGNAQKSSSDFMEYEAEDRQVASCSGCVRIY